MEEYSVKKLKKLKHLSDFTIAEVITSLGLYEPVIIDPTDIVVEETTGAGGQNTVFLPGEDVRMLYLMVRSEDPLMLPCAYCKKEQPFKGEDSLEYFSTGTTYTIHKDGLSCEIEPLRSYFRQNLIQKGINAGQFHDAQLKKAEETNRANILQMLNLCSNSYTCQLNSKHKVFVSYVVEEIRLVDELTEENKDDYIKYKNCLILKKIGQYPSMADMQFFDCIKYKKILKENYKDYTMALGLYASGVGAGAFLYLRRVLEKLVEEAHQKCISIESWDEQLYKEAHFDDKIKYVESAGETIIPAELDPIRKRIYGVLSKGVHESDEDECKDLFPYIKFAIDLILDNKLLAKERAERIKRMQATLQ